MADNGNQENNLASTLCKAGCGFFGNPQFDGMCSKCYKDAVKRKNAAPSDSTTGRTSPHVSSSAALVAAAAASASLLPNTTPSVETATPTVLVPRSDIPIVDDVAGSPASAYGTDEEACGSPSSGSSDKPRKRNRCFTCKKKVGLTGFECRCGGVFCSIHRYSDKHDCQFDYKEHGADLIRKNNPVVVGEKVQKI